jgi:hypothetical protein
LEEIITPFIMAEAIMKRPTSPDIGPGTIRLLCLPRRYIVNSQSQTPRLNLQVPGVHAGRVGASGRAVGLSSFGLSYGFDLEGAEAQFITGV